MRIGVDEPVPSVPVRARLPVPSLTEAPFAIVKVPPSQAAEITGLFVVSGIVILQSATGAKPVSQLEPISHAVLLVSFHTYSKAVTAAIFQPLLITVSQSFDVSPAEGLQFLSEISFE